MEKSIRVQLERRGAAAVEFAVTLPVMVMLLLGMVELGRALQVYHQMYEAARAGARIYSGIGNTETDIRTMVATAMADTVLDPEDYQVTLNPTDPSTVSTALTQVSVTVSTNFDDISWLVGNTLLSGETLIATCIMPFDSAEASSIGGGGNSGGGGGDDDDDDDDDDDE